MPDNQASSIEGIITRAGTDLPIADVRLSLHRGNSSFSATANTDKSGHFKFEDLVPGHYLIHGGRDGYINLATLHIPLAAGQRARMPDVTLRPAATIRGRILNSNGQPVVGRMVEFLEQGTEMEGHRSWRPRAMAVTNDNGDYRESRLEPGTYYLRSGAFPSRSMNGDEAATAYFPGTTDANAAIPIDVAADEEATADFAVPKTETYKIIGQTISPLPSSDALSRLGLLLLPRDSTSPLEQPRPVAMLDLPKGSNGDFELRGIPTGNYDLFVIGWTPDNDYTCKVPIRVNDRDLEGVQAVLRPGQDVRGRLVVEDGEDSVLRVAPGHLAELSVTQGHDRGRIAAWGTSKNPNEILIKLERTDGFQGGRYAYGPLVDDAGTAFTFPNVPEGSYRIVAWGSALMHLRGNTYLADIRVGGSSILNDGSFVVGAGPLDSIEVILGTNGGSVRGVVPGKGDEKIQLLLIPEPRLRKNAALFAMYTLSESQREFNLSGLAPGNYKFLAVGSANRDIPFQGSEFLAKYENVARPLTIEKGSRLTGVEVPLVSWPLSF